MQILINIILIILTILVIWLLYKFYFIKEKLAENLLKNSKIDKKNLESEKFSNPIKKKIEKIQYKNIKFIIKIGTIKKELEIKLFDEELPLTSKNFRVLATRGISGKNYKNSIIHRVIKDFMIQGGDIINGDGTGSISIYGKNFEDEAFKYSHDRKGLLSMANSGPDTNGSQFFITLGPCKHLDNKHVVFGEVVNGFETLDKIQNLSTDNKDKPYQPVEIIDCFEI